MKKYSFQKQQQQKQQQHQQTQQKDNSYEKKSFSNKAVSLFEDFILTSIFLLFIIFNAFGL